MNDLSVIDRFLSVFSQYIDSGFGLLGGEVAFLTATLVAIDMVLAGLFWAMGGVNGSGEDVIAKLIKKTLYVGAFAFIIGNFNALAGILFRSFAGLGLVASGSALTQAQLLQPGHIAQVGVDAGRPIMAQIGDLAGFPEVFLNIDSIAVLFLAWLIVIVSFFVLAVQLFVTLIEFKLTTLAGFVLLPFALWNKTAFLAERVLGNVVSSGIKVLVLAVIVGIGSGLFAEFQLPPGSEPSIDNALAIMLASLTLFGLGIFGPGIATGLVSGAPQLGAGAAAGAAIGVAGLAAAGTAAVAASSTAVAAGARLLPGAAQSATSGLGSAGRSATGVSGSARAAYDSGAAAVPEGGPRVAAAGVASVARAGTQAVGRKLAEGARSIRDKAAGGMSPGDSSDSDSKPAAAVATSDGPASPSANAPDWAKHLQRRQQIAHGAAVAAQVLRSSDHGGGGASPSLRDESQT
ncbi:P-type conjugative transfer protein TrbL [Caenimonas soli]|uniref:P-type conjugative transfer protein TrbL n=1 Tax=Caenimonas soli TaxID=2735555 RepID=UPI0015559A88|nr:P-type conjugative transfer protein TrbL [Caenimonas soli]NPC57781.1 P-type conjugative transfer protein TrbL [Caenimonas soli]